MDCDVVVAGAGPVGLLLAAELRLAGASVVVLERSTEQSQAIKAGGINSRAQIAVLRPDPHSRAMRAVLGDLMKGPGTTERLVGMLPLHGALRRWFGNPRRQNHRTAKGENLWTRT